MSGSEKGMPSLSLPDHLIWFAHCPKAGGTSVEAFMVARWGAQVGHLHWGWDLWWKQGGWRVADPPNSPQHLVWEDAVKQLPRAPDQVFALVRDPVTRLQSEYRWQGQKRRGTRLGKALAYLPFSLWLRLMLAVVRRHPYAFDNHLRPQSEFVPEGARVFRLEDGLEAPLAWLREVVGDSRTIDVPHSLSTGRASPVVAADRARIAAVYAADYRRFGYPLPDAAYRRDPGDWIAICLAPVLAALDRRGAL